jgi:hypothetical protein
MIAKSALPGANDSKMAGAAAPDLTSRHCVAFASPPGSLAPQRMQRSLDTPPEQELSECYFCGFRGAQIGSASSWRHTKRVAAVAVASAFDTATT